MEAAPIIITVTELRRSAARIIDDAIKSDTPVFVTQNGHATAVLLSRRLYDRLLHGAVLEPDAEGAARSASEPAQASSRPDRRSRRSPLVETLFGLCDPETASFLADEGFEAETLGPAAAARGERADSAPGGAGDAGRPG